MNRLKQILIAIDQLVNAICGGWADETLSSRAWRRGQDGGKWKVLRVVIDGIFFWEPDHCHSAWLSEQSRAHLPASFRVP